MKSNTNGGKQNWSTRLLDAYWMDHQVLNFEILSTPLGEYTPRGRSVQKQKDPPPVAVDTPPLGGLFRRLRRRQGGGFLHPAVVTRCRCCFSLHATSVIFLVLKKRNIANQMPVLLPRISHYFALVTCGQRGSQNISAATPPNTQHPRLTPLTARLLAACCLHA